MFCSKCGKEIQEGKTICSYCNLENNVDVSNSNTKKPFYKQWWLWVIVGLFIIVAVTSPKNGKTSSVLNSSIQSSNSVVGQIASSTPSSLTIQQTGIDITKFDSMVKTQISNINNDNVIGKIETRINSSSNNIAYVYLYLSDNNYWDSATTTQKKEFVSSLGKLMDAVGSNTKYTQTETIGVVTYIMSKNGIELAKKTIMGNIDLK